MGRHIYLDYNASTPIAPEVVAAMRPFLSEHFGNPSSGHWAGRPAKEAVERARGQVADLLGCRPREVVFTSGGTEANNHAIKGVFFESGGDATDGAHVITTQIEHPATLEPCAWLERQCRASVTYLPVDRAGQVDPEDVRRAITPKTVLVSVMHANNEVGTIQPIAEIAAIARERGIAFHTDAAQSVGKIQARVDELGVDLLSVAGHKVYAPKGVGALYVRDGTRCESFVHGAGHEGGRRAGTENVLLIVGLGAACELAKKSFGDVERIRELRDRFWADLHAAFGDRVVLNGHPTERLPNTLNVSFVGHVGAELLGRLDGVAASTGSACHEGAVTISPVLAAMNVPPDVARGAIRFSLGRATTWDELADVLAKLKDGSV